MNRIIALILCICTSVTNILFAHPKDDLYRRNSLCVGIISNPETGSNTITRLIYNAASEYQVSDKYNDHNIGIPIVDLGKVEISRQDIATYQNATKRNFLYKMNSALITFNNTLGATPGEQRVTLPELDEGETTIIKLKKYLASKNVPALLVAKWFNASNTMNEGSHYNMSLIQERGAYNASELEILKAKESIRGMSILKDAGMELIPNTYVVLFALKLESAAEVLARRGEIAKSSLQNLGKSVNKNFSTKEDKKVGYTTYQRDSKTGKLTAIQKTKTISANQSMTNQVTNKISSSLSRLGKYAGNIMEKEAKTTAGYYVTATTYLFKLKWDENTENLFISKYYDKSPSILLQSNDFELEFIDSATDQSMFTERTSFEAQNENNLKLVKRATMQAIDKCIANLQKKHEDFKVKAPIIDVDEKWATAFIGYKEGLGSSTKFEVLEKTYNEKKNTYRYKKVGTLKVDKERIWDNRYSIDGSSICIGDKEDGITPSNVDRTYLKGSTKKLAPGMLIRQTN